MARALIPIQQPSNCITNGNYYSIGINRCRRKRRIYLRFSDDQIAWGKGSPANGGGGGKIIIQAAAVVEMEVAGGIGGYQLDGCGGPTSDNGGIGGVDLAVYSNASNKIFLGGGGGSGPCE